ncbi:hypothetical protein [Thalassotalea sp. Y01]|uniref:hypothetical protein n=1 Tax=Thalassotalea sp. Y01 TaxID=2729613 RepID=UPI00145F9A8B|nr:hypothetical protein [Thalassotalea sp. Y01]NMP16327.1 hypothetical protein [Thalassotalea sp. Y01]
MVITIALSAILVVLMLRSGLAEYKYYQSVKTLEPDVWQQLGAPKFLKIPMVFVSPKGAQLLKSIRNETVCALAKKHRHAGIMFQLYVVSVLVVSIVYFKFY